jgi:hypothetical protein
MRASFWYILEIKKKLGLRGVKTAPLGIVLKKKVFSHKPRKSPNPGPIHTQGTVTCEWAGS